MQLGVYDAYLLSSGRQVAQRSRDMAISTVTPQVGRLIAVGKAGRGAYAI